MKRLRIWLRLLWLDLTTRCALWWTETRHRIANERFNLALTETHESEAKEALRRVIDARLFPPDCVSAGSMHGGPALFFKHDEATEVFIAHTYAEAAERLLTWWRDENAAQVAPVCRTTTTMNRAERRAWKSRRRPNLAGRRTGT